MKQIYRLAIFLGVLPNAFSAQYFESFDSPSMPPGWVIINDKGSGVWKTWSSYDSTFNIPRSGSHFLGLEYDSSAHNCFVVSPAISIKTGISDRLTFWAKNRGAGLKEKFDVKISTTKPISGDFSCTILSEVKPSTSWAQYSYDLSPYIGQNVYITFHSSTKDHWFVGIDDFQVSGNKLQESVIHSKTASIYPNPVKDVLSIENKNKMSEISIYDFSGKMYHREKVNTENIKINVKNLPAGNYILKINEGETEKSYRIIKE